MNGFMSNLLTILINGVTSLVNGLIFLRIIMKLFGASTQAPFVDWVYKTTLPLLNPFVGMFPSPVIDGRFVLEFSALFAIIVYSFVSYLAVGIVEGLQKLAQKADNKS